MKRQVEKFQLLCCCFYPQLSQIAGQWLGSLSAPPLWHILLHSTSPSSSPIMMKAIGPQSAAMGKYLNKSHEVLELFRNTGNGPHSFRYNSVQGPTWISVNLSTESPTSSPNISAATQKLTQGLADSTDRQLATCRLGFIVCFGNG